MKLFVSDYDMTIYINENINDSVFKSIREWRNSWNIFAIATGRNKFSIFEHIDRYNLEFDYVIANNGALIFNSNREIIFEDTIDENIAYNVIKFLYNKFNGSVEITSNNENISVIKENDDYELPFRVHKKITIDEINTIKNIVQINKIIRKDSKNTENIAKIINNEFDRVIAYANIRTVDIVKYTVNKVNGVSFLEKVIKNNNKIIDKVLVAGDSNNDIEMIKKYDGYAQINARENVKSITNKYFYFISDIINKEI